MHAPRHLTAILIRHADTAMCLIYNSGAAPLLATSEGANAMYTHLMPFSRPLGEETRQVYHSNTIHHMIQHTICFASSTFAVYCYYPFVRCGFEMPNSYHFYCS
jgi:hypothetical protein